MSKYIKNFVSGHGISFQISRRNQEAFEQAASKWIEINSHLDINQNSIVLCCGAKNNGKSSLLRYIINQHIEHTNNYVYYVDFDPGQAEMATPGTVSAHLVKSPLLSPSYLNVLQHEHVAMSSVGGTNMSVNPRLLIENCKYIFKTVKEHQSARASKSPIFINTMGYIRNVGLAMLMDLVKICRPTDLIVLNVENDPMRSIYADLGPTCMTNAPASFYYNTANQSEILDYKYHLYNLKFSFVDSTSVATKNRTGLQLAYFATVPEALYKPVMQLEPKWLSLSSVSIYCVSSYPLKEKIVLELLYHSWVHLVKLKKNPSPAGVNQQNPFQTGQTAEHGSVCNVIEDVGENSMLGCAIVADIDLDKLRLAMITPLSQEILDRDVNCIIKPLSIQVPREMIQEPTDQQ